MYYYANEELGCMPTAKLNKLNQTITNKQNSYLANQLRCIEMIDSCLTYDQNFFAPRDNEYISVYDKDNEDTSYAARYYKDLGKSSVIQLYNLRKEYFANHVTVQHNVVTDYEGATYSILKEH